MALDYQKSMYSKEKIQEIKNKYRRTSYEQMSLWQSVATSGNKTSDINELLERQQYPAHLNYSTSGGYDDMHKSYLRFQKDAGAQNGFPKFGPPRLRNGKTGGSWRHVTEVLQAEGSRLVFMDGRPGLADMTLMRGGDIPGCNLIHGLADRPKTIVSGRFVPRQPKQLGSHELEAFKATESGNWHLMR